MTICQKKTECYDYLKLSFLTKKKGEKKMFRPALFSILFLLFCKPVLPQDSKPDNFSYDIKSLDFWNKARIMPVRFLDKVEDKQGNTRFSGTFASDFVLEMVNFILPAGTEGKDAFFEQSKEWEEQIDRKTFLKKFKKDFWLITYLETGQDNIIVSGHQFKEWQAVKISYASHPDQLRRSIDNPDFWREMRLRVAFFYAFNEDKAYWMFLDAVNKAEPFTDSDHEFITLSNGSKSQKRLTVNPLFDYRILEQGMFFIQKNTVFHKQEIENTKPRKVLKFTITDPKLRLRPVPTDREYFMVNHLKHFWVSFYDSKYQSLVRVVETIDEPAENEEKKN